MSTLVRELVFLILQFLEERKYKDTVHVLERESGYFFNMKYFEEKVLAGEWDEVEKYLSGFTKFGVNGYSLKIFYLIRRQKYLEALDRNDRAKAVEILMNDLKVFSKSNKELYKEMTQLLTLENIREKEEFAMCGDTKSVRSSVLDTLKKLIKENPLSCEKLVFPKFEATRLRTLLNQSLNWQHLQCKNPRPNPEIKSLFTDHRCSPPNGARASTPVTFPVAAVAKPSTDAPLEVQEFFPPNPTSLSGLMVNSSPFSLVQSSVIAASAPPVPVPTSLSGLMVNASPFSPVQSSAIAASASAPPVPIPTSLSGLMVNASPFSLVQSSVIAASASASPRPVPTSLSGLMVNASPFSPVQSSVIAASASAPPVPIPTSLSGLMVNASPFSPVQSSVIAASASAPPGPVPTSLSGLMVNASPFSPVQSSVIAAPAPAPPVPVPQNQGLQHPNTLGMIEYGSTDQKLLVKRKRSRSARPVGKVTYPAPAHQSSWSLDDLPKYVACTIHQGSNVTSMDFHPSHHTLLTVGCGNGEISLWEVGKRERLLTEPFKIWNMAACSGSFKAKIANDSSISVNRVAWSPDGNLIGIAFKEHIVHLLAYQGSNDLRPHLEIEAHVGGVNDIAFSYPNKKLWVVTCGDDKLVKVWDLDGSKLFNFEGHEAPVYSVCPHQKKNIPFIFSTAIDGKIKAWLYDNMGSRVNYDAPGQWCTRMLYSSDGSRLFSCGTSKDGDSFLVEWNENEGKIKRTFSGFTKNTTGVVQFDTTNNRFLAVGDDRQIKFWDMDNTSILTSTDAGGGLLSLPRLRFNKEGNLLVVTTADNGFKVLANANGLRALRAMEARSYKASRIPLEMKNGVEPMSRGRGIEKPINLEDVSDKTKPWELTEIVDPTQCRTVTIPDNSNTASKVARLLYTNSGVAVLAIWSNGVQKIWKWSRSEQNPSGKATASIIPQLWQPKTGLLMTNDVPDNSEDAVPCIVLSKNDSYVMSACGGKVSLFNLRTFKVLTTFTSPPPASTFLAIHPKDNNIIAIGMEDSAIHIYNVKMDEVKTKLKGHQKRITGLAFSTSHDILVSSDADAKLFFWNTDNWEKIKSVSLNMPDAKASQAATSVQFHSDQVRLLVCHETLLAVCDVKKMECIRQWLPQQVLSSPISSAAYSCDSQLVYATFTDGNIGVFDADSLKLRCRIAPSAYISPALSNSQTIHPLVVTTHPQEANQLAVGLTDGTVKVIEPSEMEKQWGLPVPVDNGTENGGTAAASTTNTYERLQR